jgi:hypothetical protein
MTICTETPSIEYHFAECRDNLNVVLSIVRLDVIMLNIIMLNVIMLNVVRMSII